MVDTIGGGKPARIIGLSLRGRPWRMLKEAIIGKANETAGKRRFRKDGYAYLSIGMPCGNTLTFKSRTAIRKLKRQDVPCPCGDPTHWLIKFEEEVKVEARNT